MIDAGRKMIERLGSYFSSDFFLLFAGIGAVLGFWVLSQWRTRSAVIVSFVVAFLAVAGLPYYDDKFGSNNAVEFSLLVGSLLIMPIAAGWIVGAPLGWLAKWWWERSSNRDSTGGGTM